MNGEGKGSVGHGRVTYIYLGKGLIGMEEHV